MNGGQPFYFQLAAGRVRPTGGQDRNGNVTHLTNASGVVIEKYKYDAFGAVTVYDGAGNLRTGGTAYKNRFLFTGSEPSEWGHREIDGQVREGSGRAERERTSQYAATFGYYEYRARAYNPVLGRFMSEDPKGFDAGDYNLFRYVHNDPLDLTDPMGLEAGGPQPGDNPQMGPAVANPQQIEKQFKHEVERFDAQKVEATRALNPSLRSVIPGAIKQMIDKLQNNPGQFHDLNSAKAAGTQVIKAFLDKRIAVGQPINFKPTNPMIRTRDNRLLINPKYLTPKSNSGSLVPGSRIASHLPSLLAHEGAHFAEPFPFGDARGEDFAQGVQRDFDGVFRVDTFHEYTHD